MDQKVAAENETFALWVFFNPRYRHPLVLATNLEASPAAIYRLYRDRWPVEQVPLAAKQMLGLHRSFVFAAVSVWRLPEFAIFAGNFLTMSATILPPIPSGYWERRPKNCRPLAASPWTAHSANSCLLQGRFRKKASVTDHLPKGIDAHR